MAMAPPFSLDSALVSQLAALCEQLGRLSVQLPEAQALRLRRASRIRTIQGSLAIEGNTLSESQITAILKKIERNNSPQVAQLLQVLEGGMLRNEIQQALGLKGRKSFNARDLKPALDAGLVAMALPDKPSSRLQRYRLTEHGSALKRTTA